MWSTTRTDTLCAATTTALSAAPAVTVLPPFTRHQGVRNDACAAPLAVRTLAVTQSERDGIVGKHLLDETAEFRMPRIGRHAADDELETTQRIERAPSQRPAPGAPEDDEAR